MIKSVFGVRERCLDQYHHYALVAVHQLSLSLVAAGLLHVFVLHVVFTPVISTPFT